MINIDFFKKLDLRVATIVAAHNIPGADKLLKLEVDLGSESRTLVAGIAQEYACEDLPGKQVVIVANMQPVKLRGVESHGMVLAAVVAGKPVLVTAMEEVPAGSSVL
jgi:methionyl-tRNA synthetase